MEKILLLIDNSNIFIAGKAMFGANARFSYANFEKVCRNSGVIVEKHLAGSTPPANDAFWEKMKRDGYKVHTYARVPAGYGHTKEKGVDMVLGINGTHAIGKIQPDRVVLLTGDRDFVPIADLRDGIKNEQGTSFVLDVWAFSDALSSELERVCDNVFKIEDFKEDVIYFQYENGGIESFLEREKRMAKEARQAEEERIAQIEKRREAERIAQDKKMAEAKIAREQRMIEEKNKQEKSKKRRANVQKVLGFWGGAAAVVGLFFLGKKSK